MPYHGVSRERPQQGRQSDDVREPYDDRRPRDIRERHDYQQVKDRYSGQRSTDVRAQSGYPREGEPRGSMREHRPYTQSQSRYERDTTDRSHRR